MRLVVCDVDDTLYLERDYVRSGFQAVSAWLTENRSIDGFAARAWKRFEAGRRKTIFDETLEELGHGADPSLIRRLVEVYRHHTPRIRLQEDGSRWIEQVHGRVHLAVISDGPLPSQQAKVEVLGLDRWFENIVLTDSRGIRFRKPHPWSFRSLQRSFDIRPHDCAYIADNPAKDFVAPHDLGWRTIRLRRPGGLHRLRKSLEDVDLEVESLDDPRVSETLGWAGR